MTLPQLKPQQIPPDSPESCNFFVPSGSKPFLATPGAIDAYGDAIGSCLAQLQALAQIHHGLDYLQVFESPGQEALWLIEDGDGGAITALLSSEY